jgi:hypothetical protein
LKHPFGGGAVKSNNIQGQNRFPSKSEFHFVLGCLRIIICHPNSKGKAIFMQKLLLCCLLICCTGLFLCCGGCARAAAALMTPTPWETKIPAEYDLGEKKPKRMLVLVEQPTLATSEANMRVYLTQSLESLIEDKIDIKAEAFVPYRNLAEMRTDNPDFSSLTPVQVGKALRAQMVLYVVIDNFSLYGLSDAGYYSGQLDIRSGLYDVDTGQRIWPESGELKSVSVVVETQKGQEETVTRLAQSMARCVVRYFYNCPKPEFRVGDENKTEEMKNW